MVTIISSISSKGSERSEGWRSAILELEENESGQVNLKDGSVLKAEPMYLPVSTVITEPSGS